MFVNAALRLQALDHSLLATHFSSITSSVIVYKSLEYTFFLNVDSLIVALEAIIRDAREKLMVKGDAYCDYAANLLTAAKMGSAYGRLSLCMMNATLNTCPLPFHCCTATTPMVLKSYIYLPTNRSILQLGMCICMTSRNLIDRGQEVSPVGPWEFSNSSSILTSGIFEQRSFFSNTGTFFWEYVENCSVNSLNATNGSKSSINTLQNVLSASLPDVHQF